MSQNESISELKKHLRASFDNMTRETVKALQTVHSFESKPIRSEPMRRLLAGEHVEPERLNSKQPGTVTNTDLSVLRKRPHTAANNDQSMLKMRATESLSGAGTSAGRAQSAGTGLTVPIVRPPTKVEKPQRSASNSRFGSLSADSSFTSLTRVAPTLHTVAEEPNRSFGYKTCNITQLLKVNKTPIARKLGGQQRATSKSRAPTTPPHTAVHQSRAAVHPRSSAAAGTSKMPPARTISRPHSATAPAQHAAPNTGILPVRHVAASKAPGASTAPIVASATPSAASTAPHVAASKVPSAASPSGARPRSSGVIEQLPAIALPKAGTAGVFRHGASERDALFGGDYSLADSGAVLARAVAPSNTSNSFLRQKLGEVPDLAAPRVLGSVKAGGSGCLPLTAPSAASATISPSQIYSGPVGVNVVSHASTPLRTIVSPEQSTQSIDYSNFSNFSFIADWAHTPEVTKRAAEQRLVDPYKVFGAIEPVNIEAIFRAEKERQMRTE